MAESVYYSDRRQFKRALASQGATAVLITSSPEVIGSIVDISMGGVKITYHNQKDTDLDYSELKVDLISDDRFVEAIPCKNAWDREAEVVLPHEAGDLRQCGIEFMELTPNQAFLLKGFIRRCGGPEAEIDNPDLSIVSNQ
jgi:c-di-GMP-binding flagellar brake protein YcgR